MYVYVYVYIEPNPTSTSVNALRPRGRQDHKTLHVKTSTTPTRCIRRDRCLLKLQKVEFLIHCFSHQNCFVSSA